MDRELLRLLAHIDQTRADVRTALEGMARDDLVGLFRACTGGRLAGMDEPTVLLVGMLAALAICDIRRSRDNPDE